MLFDLRSRGRRRTVQIVYVLLALLMGGGLVFFGIGTGGGGGGLLDAFTGGSGASSVDQKALDKKVTTAGAQANAAANDPAAWANYATVAATTAEQGLDAKTGRYTPAAIGDFHQASDAWHHYVGLNPKPVDPDLQQLMLTVYQQGLADAASAVPIQEMITAATPDNPGGYVILAQLAYAAGQARKGDLASARALALTPVDKRGALGDRLKQYKQTGTGATGPTGAAGARGAAPAAPPAPPAPPAPKPTKAPSRR